MEVKKINTVNNDGTISEIEVNFDVWEFDKDDFWKQDWQERKKKKEDSYEEIRRIYEEVYKCDLPEELKANSSEDQYIEKYQIQKLHEAINKLPQKQKERVVLRFFYDLTLEQIAKIENIDHSAISKSIKFALKKLKNFLS